MARSQKIKIVPRRVLITMNMEHGIILYMFIAYHTDLQCGNMKIYEMILDDIN